MDSKEHQLKLGFTEFQFMQEIIKRQNANEAYAHATFKIAPEVTIKNIHAYDTEVPITISKGASEATITLPDGTKYKNCC